MSGTSHHRTRDFTWSELIASLQSAVNQSTSLPENPDHADEVLAAARAVHEKAVLARHAMAEQAGLMAATDENESQPASAPADGPLRAPSAEQIWPTLGINDKVRFSSALFGGNMQRLREACAAAEGEQGSVESAKELAEAGLDWKDEEGAGFAFVSMLGRMNELLA